MSYPVIYQELIDHYLGEYRFKTVKNAEGLVTAMRYSLLIGGKRVRPTLALATASAIGEKSDSVLFLAAALEMIHTYSLVHDDLPPMDDDDLRRGQLTCHKKFGENVAILAGDALYAEAFSLLLANSDEFPPEALLASAALLAEASGTDGMVGGQYIDVLRNSDGSLMELQEMHQLKTGRLISASVCCVLKLFQVEGEQYENFQKFSSELGLLFQIVDDIIDVTQTSKVLGKPSGSDLKQDKHTYISEFGLEGAQKLADATHAQALKYLQAADPKTSELVAVTNFIRNRNS